MFKIGQSGATLSGGGISGCRMEGGQDQYSATISSTGYDCLHFETTGTDNIFLWRTENNWIQGFRCGMYIGGKSRSPYISGNHIWRNWVGVYIDEEHPIWGEPCDLRYNVYAISGDVIFDMQFTGGHKLVYNLYGMVPGAFGTEPNGGSISATLITGGNWIFESRIEALRLSGECYLSDCYFTPSNPFALTDAVLSSTTLTVEGTLTQNSNEGEVLRVGDPLVFEGTGETLSAHQATITGISQADVGVVTATGHGFTSGDWVSLASITGMTELNGQSARITVINANSFYLDGVDTGVMTAYTSGGTATLQLDGGENFTVGARTNNVMTVYYAGSELDATGVSVTDIEAGTLRPGFKQIVIQGSSIQTVLNCHIEDIQWRPNISSKLSPAHGLIRVIHPGGNPKEITINGLKGSLGADTCWLQIDAEIDSFQANNWNVTECDVAIEILGAGALDRYTICNNNFGYAASSSASIGLRSVVNIPKTTFGGNLTNNYWHSQSTTAGGAYVFNIDAARTVMTGNNVRTDASAMDGAFNILDATDAKGVSAGVDQATTTTNNLVTTF